MFTLFLVDSGHQDTYRSSHELVDAIESMELPPGVKLGEYVVQERGKIIVQGNGYKL